MIKKILLTTCVDIEVKMYGFTIVATASNNHESSALSDFGQTTGLALRETAIRTSIHADIATIGIVSPIAMTISRFAVFHSVDCC